MYRGRSGVSQIPGLLGEKPFCKLCPGELTEIQSSAHEFFGLHFFQTWFKGVQRLNYTPPKSTDATGRFTKSDVATRFNNFQSFPLRCSWFCQENQSKIVKIDQKVDRWARGGYWPLIPAQIHRGVFLLLKSTFLNYFSKNGPFEFFPTLFNN